MHAGGDFFKKIFLIKKAEFIPFFSGILVQAHFINRSVGFNLVKQEAPVLYE